MPNSDFFSEEEWRIIMTTNKRFTVKQRQGATIYSIIDYYGELPLSEGIYYKSNANKLCEWLNTQHELLNTLYHENEELKASNEGLLKDLYEGFKLIKSVEKENQQLVKMLDNVTNYMQREHKEIPIDDFVEWWNNIATEGLEDDNGVNENKIRKRKVKADGRVDYVGISKEDLE